MPDQGHDVADDGDHARGEELVEHVDVAGDAGHQAADRVAVEERQRHALELPNSCMRRSYMMRCPTVCMIDIWK